MTLPRYPQVSRLALLVIAAAAAGQAHALALVPDTINMFRDTRGANDVGQPTGDRFQFGADVVGGSAGVALGAVYGPSGFAVNPFNCTPLAVNRNFCANLTGYSANRLQPWTLRFTKGAELLEATGPSLSGAEVPAPFPVSVSMSGTGLTPTISWQVPGGFAPDAFRVNIYDKGRRLANGIADVIHSEAIDPSSTSYTLPSELNSGQELAQGGNYTINLQLIETRGNLPLTGNNNTNTLRRSSSFFAFTPLTGNVPDDVALPSVDNGVYNFNIAAVGPGAITFIDPFVAVGYDYAAGAGDPNFASVLLPAVGDAQFTLDYTDASGAHSVALAAGTQYFFGPSGVRSFRVSGIETSAMLDPANVTAFITGLTFSSSGSFTGTMTPITQYVSDVPETGTAALLCAGLLAIGAALQRRQRIA